jgi:small basic protein
MVEGIRAQCMRFLHESVLLAHFQKEIQLAFIIKFTVQNFGVDLNSQICGDLRHEFTQRRFTQEMLQSEVP